MKFFIAIAITTTVAFASLHSAAQTMIKIDNAGVALDGYFYAATSTDGRKAPAIVALHGCNGMIGPHGKPNLRTRDYAKLLNEQGWHVLFVDSFTARGVKTVCGSGGNVPPTERVGDVQAAVALLAKRSEVDSDRLALLGWSHGGSTALLANGINVHYAKPIKAAVAYYPGCGSSRSQDMQRLWTPAKPLLMLLGESDDWTNPVPCQRLAVQHPALVMQHTYANAHHGFDSDAPLQQVPSVISATTKKPVHLGGEPAAKFASQAAFIAFLKDHFK